MTLANIVTVIRFIGIAPLLWLFFGGPSELFYTLLVFILLGDLLDGALARGCGQITALGQMLDPLVDKALFFSLLIALAVRGDLPLWSVIAFLLPQGALLLGALWLRLKFRRWIIVEARFWGKASATLLALGILGLFIAREPAIPVLYAGLALSYVAAFDYYRIARARLAQQPRELLRQRRD